jgi:hypothetical protein
MPYPSTCCCKSSKNRSLRDAVSQVAGKMRAMVRLLFFEFPPRPYEMLLPELGMATGSIGAIRGRCLAQLRKHLEKRGF